MIKFVSLFSGSSGNSYFFEIDNKKYLVDVGVSRARIEKELKEIGESLKNIDAIFITHEHIDHIRGLSIINKNYNIPIYINKKTFKKVNNKLSSLNKDTINLFEKKEFNIDDIKIKPFSVIHDAADPVGFSFFDKDGNKATIVTDLGEITEEVIKNVSNSDLLVVESNYDEQLIRYSPYPIEVVNRIISPNGHLSNLESLNLVSSLMDKGLKNIALAHISKSNNNHEIVSQMFNENINNKNLEKNEINFQILKADGNSGTIIIK